MKNTEKVSTDTGWKLIADVCHKADGNELLRGALKKLANMNKKSLATFLGEVQTLFGCLKKVVPNILLESTEYLINTREFFKTKENGGIFAYVDPDIFNWFYSEINSTAKELASYEFTEDITEENIVGDAKGGNIYEEVDFAHIKQICERHILKGEKLLEENGRANLFWVRNKKGRLRKVDVWLHGDGWVVFVNKFRAQCGWYAGSRSFFRN